MVVVSTIKKGASTTTAAIISGDLQVPVINLQKSPRISLSKDVVKSCEEYGIFKVINHRVPHEVVTKLEQHGSWFFEKPAWEKQQYTSKPPLGYGCKNIGFNGDMGELEYLLLRKNNPDDHVPSSSTSGLPTAPCSTFSGAVNEYVRAVEELACEVLDLVAEGLRLPQTQKTALSSLIRSGDSDSLLRLNHYPTLSSASTPRVGFGEHTDPQILTILRSNNVEGLQVQTRQDGLWVSVPPDPHAFYVMVGDALQVMTNGRFESVKHRVIMSSDQSRMSIVYFCAPPLDATIRPLPMLVETSITVSSTADDTTINQSHQNNFLNPSQQQPLQINRHVPRCNYRAFTWAEYKTAAYSSRLGDSRLNLFKTCNRVTAAPMV